MNRLGHLLRIHGHPISCLQSRAIGGSGKIGRERKNWEKDAGYAEAIERNTKTHSSLKRKEEWMAVRYRGLDVTELEIQRLAQDEALRSDPAEARAISDDKLLRLEQSLSSRGFARELRPYTPPEDAKERILASFEEATSKSAPEDLWSIQLTDHVFKFKFLKICTAKFNHEIENCDLHRMKTVGDVAEYYLTPVRGVNAYDQLVRQQDQLPANLFILPEAKQFDPNETNTFYKGIDAYPGFEFKQHGIRASQKYKSLKGEFKWPDI